MCWIKWCYGPILNFLRHGTATLPRDETAVKELQTEAEYYCIPDLVEICKNSMLKMDWKLDEHRFFLQVSRGSINELSNSRQTRYSIRREAPTFRIPVNADDTISLSKLKFFFPSATGICHCIPENHYLLCVGPLRQMASGHDEVIFPPEGGWCEGVNTYCVIPFK